MNTLLIHLFIVVGVAITTNTKLALVVPCLYYFVVVDSFVYHTPSCHPTIQQPQQQQQQDRQQPRLHYRDLKENLQLLPGQRQRRHDRPMQPFCNNRYRCSTQQQRLYMGLYDKPVPPMRLPPEDSQEKVKDDQDDDGDDNDYVSERLFDFNINGKEVNDLLPSLRRKLIYDVECYYIPTDRIVQNLVEKTKVNVMDACWALEACSGDITEAWTRISVARRLRLEQKRQPSLSSNDNDLMNDDDMDDYEIDIEAEYEQRKKNRIQQEMTRQKNLYNQPLKPDTAWLPRQNPKPVDDEPWFTG